MRRLKKNTFFFFFFIAVFHMAPAQPVTGCDDVEDFFNRSMQKIKKINTEDPELIPLHYLFLQDIQSELQDFSANFIPRLHECKELNYYTTVSSFDRLSYLAKMKMDTLQPLYRKVDSLFYDKALNESYFENTENALYYLSRSLQYNPLNPDALILKCRLLFEEKSYEECIDILQILYHQCELKEKHENQISDFTMLFYSRLYEKADSLASVELASDALDLFKVLEKFCHNMPSNYCNDDYYHGILRSKTGVYESYIRIAKVARERGNREIEIKFLEYAEQYRLENADDILNRTEYELVRYDDEKDRISLSDNGIILPNNVSTAADDTVSYSPTEDTLASHSFFSNNKTDGSETGAHSYEANLLSGMKVTESGQRIDTDFPESEKNADIKNDSLYFPEEQVPDENLQKEIDYHRLFIEAVALCMENHFDSAYKSLQKAMELEQCECFPVDDRVKILFQSLSEVLR